MKIDDVIFASLISETTYKLIYRVPGWGFLYQVYQARLGECMLNRSARLQEHLLNRSPLRTHVESLGKPHGSTSILKALLGKFDIKRHSPSILYL